ncbi:MAG: ATP-dependent RecD-like DNA helicase [Legionellaceae bacterium]
MLSVKPIESVQQAAHYFYEQDNYYLKDAPEIENSTAWFGKGAETLGLQGEVSKEAFISLLEGKLPDGQQLGKIADGKVEHRPGTDLTFSAPKSVSIMAEIGGDTRIRHAHQEAVKEALTFVETLCAQARKTAKRETVYENTENIIAATFLHDTSRNLDPNLHTHCVVMNMTQREDGQWRSLASSMENKRKGHNNGFNEKVFDNKPYFGAIYRASLAHKLKELGYTIEKTSHHGFFEIKDVPKQVIEHFSTRRQEIESHLEENNLTGAKAAAVAALDTREAKKAVDRETLHQEWDVRAKEQGFDAKALVKNIQDKSHEKVRSSENLLEPVAKQAVEFAIHDLSEKDTVLSHHKLLNSAIKHAIGDTTPGAVVDAIENAIKEGELILLPKEKDKEQRYTTKALLSYEQELLDLATEGLHTVMRIAPKEDIKEAASCSLLTLSQQEAVVEVLSSFDRTSLLLGYSGTGKSDFVIPQMTKMIKSHGYESLVLTPGASAAKDNQEAGINSRTVSSFIQTAEKALSLKDISAFKNQYLLIDDASMLSYKQQRDLQRLSKAFDARIILAADDKAYLPFEGGSPIEALQKAGIKTVRLREILRQKEKGHITAIEKTLAGDIKTAFEKMDSRLISIDKKSARLESMAKHYASLDERDKTLLLLPTTKECDTVNAAVHRLLKENGELNGDGLVIKALLPKFLTTAKTTSAHYYLKGDVVKMNQAQHKGQIEAGCYYTVLSSDTKTNIVTIKSENKERINWNPMQKGGKKQGAIEVFTPKKIELHEGEDIRFHKNNPSLGLYNGQKAKVIGINGDTLTVKTQEGNNLRLSVKQKDHCHLDYGYALTPYKSYHEKPHTVITQQESQTPLSTQRSFYKQLAQAKESIWLYTDDKTAYLNTVTKQTGNRLSAIEALLHNKPFVFDTALLPKDRMNTLAKTVNSVIKKEYAEFVKEKTPFDIAKEATEYAIKHLAEREAAFKERDIVETALVHALGDINPTHIKSSIDTLVKEGEIVGNQDKYNQLWTTKAAIDVEEKIIKAMDAGKGKVNPLSSQENVNAILQDSTLSKGQKEAVQLITQSTDNMVVVQGYAGTGKTTMLKTVKAILEQKSVKNTENAYSLLGLAPSHTAVEELRHNGIRAQTLDSFLVDIDKEKDALPDLSKTVIVLDEASMVSNKKFERLQSFCLENKIKLVSIGDTHQLSSPEAGKPFSVVQNVTETIAYMKDIKRQAENPLLLDSVNAMYDKAFDKTFELLEKHKTHSTLPESLKPTKSNPLGILEIDNKNDRLALLAEDYLARDDKRREKTLIVTPANADRVVVNALIREGLREEGQLKGDDNGINVLVSKNMTAIERSRASNYEINDVVRFNRSLQNLSVAKNTYWEVTSVNTKHNLLMLKDNENNTIAWHPTSINNYNLVEVYEKQGRDVAIGDTLRFTQTDKARDIFANKMAKVSDISNDGVLTLTKEGKKDEIIQWDTKEAKNQHIDHAYAMTAHIAQGKTKQEVIIHQESTNPYLANQQNFLVSITRPKLTVTLYTDNKKALIEKLKNASGEKKSAVEIIDYDFAKHRNIKSKVIENKDKQVAHKPTKNNTHYDMGSLQSRLIENAEVVVESLLGKPDKIVSTGYRYGSQKGSLIVTLKGEKRGSWYDFQTGEGSNLFNLIGKNLGHHPKKDFLKTAEYAARLVGFMPRENESVSKSKKTKISIKNLGFTEHQKKRIALANKLERESMIIHGTLGEMYLRKQRGITCQLPESLRYHPSIYVPEVGKHLPALLVIAKNEKGKTQAVQTIFLDRETHNKANIESNKRITGPIKGAIVTIQEGKSKDSPTLIAEGIETGLSLKMANKDAHIKATLGVSNFLNIPQSQISKTAVFCLDNDGAKSMSEITAFKGMQRLKNADITVFYNQPDTVKTDYNDVLKQEGINAIRAKINESIPYQPTKEIALNFKEYQKQHALHHKQQAAVHIDLYDLLTKEKEKTVVVQKFKIKSQEIEL